MLEYIKILKFMLVRDHIMKKHFKAVELKYLDDATIMKIREWRNQPFVKSMMYSQHEITEEEHRNYIAALKQDDNRGLFVFYLDDEPFGVYQYTLDREKPSVFNGCYLIKEEDQYFGYGTILNYMIQVVAHTAFNIDKMYGEVIDINKRALALQEKLGGTIEKVFQNKVQINGEKHDVYLFCYDKQPQKRVVNTVYSLIEKQSTKEMIIY